MFAHQRCAYDKYGKCMKLSLSSDAQHSEKWHIDLYVIYYSESETKTKQKKNIVFDALSIKCPLVTISLV